MRAAFALRINSGKNIFICSSETPAGVSELLFHGRDRNGKQQLPRWFPTVMPAAKKAVHAIFGGTAAAHH